MGDAEFQKAMIVILLTIATMITRFFIFPAGKKVPDFVEYLGKTLPYATMGLLVVYCLKGISLTAFPFGLPELFAVALIVALYWWKENSLLSIGVGTVFYMFLVQVVF